MKTKYFKYIYLLIISLSLTSYVIAQNEDEDVSVIFTVNEIDGTLTVSYSSIEDIYGYQFNYQGFSILDGSTVTPEGDEWDVNTNSQDMVLGFDFDGSFLPSGSGDLAIFEYEFLTTLCLQSCLRELIRQNLLLFANILNKHKSQSHLIVQSYLTVGGYFLCL